MFVRIAFSIAAAALALTACGGGGGGSAPIPISTGGGGNGGGNGGPSPSTKPSSSPGVTPTPGLTPTPSPTLTPVPTPTPQGGTILPNTTGRYSLIQVLDRRMSEQQIEQEAPYEDSVWGSFSPSYWNQYHAGMINSRYLMPFDDDVSISGHNLAWWQQNHPDWILYACDKNGNPTNYVARDDGFPNVPLDIHNPAVIQYQMQQVEIPYMQANGYNSLAADNVTFENYTGGPNSLLGQNDPGYNYGTDGWFGCGIWEGNQFVKRYTMGFGQPDPAFIGDLVNWVQAVRGYLNQAHLHFLVNHPITWPLNSNETGVISSVDGMMYEASFSNWGRYGANFPNIISYMQYVQQQHVAFFVVDYYCLNDGNPCESKLTPSQIEFSMASYQLGNEGGASLYVSPSTGDIYSYLPVYSTKMGSPCGEYTTPGTDMYARQFGGGLVVVNNSSTLTQNFNLPANHVYTDVEGRQLSNPLSVAPDDAYVMTTSGNGCS